MEKRRAVCTTNKLKEVRVARTKSINTKLLSAALGKRITARKDKYGVTLRAKCGMSEADAARIADILQMRYNGGKSIV